MGQETCGVCQSIFEEDLFDLSCKTCFQTFGSLNDFQDHFLDFKLRKLNCNATTFQEPFLDTLHGNQSYEDDDEPDTKEDLGDILDCEISEDLDTNPNEDLICKKIFAKSST